LLGLGGGSSRLLEVTYQKRVSIDPLSFQNQKIINKLLYFFFGQVLN